MEQMLAHLTAASAQAAAASLVSEAVTLAPRPFKTTTRMGGGVQPQHSDIHSPSYSPPVKRTSAQSAMPTPSLLCSSLVATNPASKCAPWTWGGK